MKITERTRDVTDALSPRAAFQSLWILCLAPALTGCLPFAIKRELTRPYSKDEVLHWTTNLATYRRCGELSRSVTVRDWDGAPTEFHYVWRRPYAGRTNTTLVFIHGYPASLFTWSEIIAPDAASPNFRAGEALAQEAELLALDLPGHGFTKSGCDKGVLAQRLTPVGAAKSVVTLLDAIGVKGNVILVGHSFGGLVTLAAAKEAAQTLPVAGRSWQLTGLVLIDPEGAPRTEFVPSERQLRSPIRGTLSGSHWLARNLGWTFSVFNPSLWRRGYWHAEADAAIRQMTTRAKIRVPDDQRHIYAWLMRIPENYYSNRALVRSTGDAQSEIVGWPGQNFRGRRILIWALDDRLFPVKRDGRFFQTHFRPQQLDLVPGAGHLVTEENPRDLASLLSAMLHH